ncbi:MAG TPA: DNA double-strand break repair nuclease NurA [Chloroflexota bacterium]|nr:DNA double-strand break repair nuclease NurA [Chloroflexota bacterium]
MPMLAPVIKAARQRRDQLHSALGVAQWAAWRSMLAPRWLQLPVARVNGEAGSTKRAVNVAVDGTSHSVQLQHGAHFILAIAAANGPAYCQDERADMEILPARFDDGQASSARDLLMRSLEALTATQAMARIVDRGEAKEAVLWIDGSLYADLSHMAGAPEKVHWGAGIERAGHLLRTTAALLGRAEQAGLWIVGIGKTQRAGFLFDALAPAGTGPSAMPAMASAVEVDGGKPADGELLSSMGVGWSWPLVLDGTRFPIMSRLALSELAECPAIVSCYVRPHAADLPLRVDVPASVLGIDDRLLRQEGSTGVQRAWPAWVPDPEVMTPVIQAALAAYGGMNVYNAPLYAVDRIVRLPRRELELRYLPICERVAGLQPGTLGVNRGRRRFLMA